MSRVDFWSYPCLSSRNGPCPCRAHSKERGDPAAGGPANPHSGDLLSCIWSSPPLGVFFLQRFNSGVPHSRSIMATRGSGMVSLGTPGDEAGVMSLSPEYFRSFRWSSVGVSNIWSSSSEVDLARVFLSIGSCFWCARCSRWVTTFV